MSAQGVEILFIDLQQVTAVIDDLAVLHDGVAGQNTQNGLGGDRFTGTGLADDGEGLALVEVEVDAADCLNLTVGGAERYSQVLYL